MAGPLKVITQQESWAEEVRQDVVERLEYLIECARSGELQGFVLVGLTADNMVITATTKNGDQAKLIGGIERVKFRMLSAED